MDIIVNNMTSEIILPFVLFQIGTAQCSGVIGKTVEYNTVVVKFSI